MTAIENLCIEVMEECAEVQQAISKALRFGFKSCHPDTPERNNAYEVWEEYLQLQAVVEMLEDTGEIGCLSKETRESIKANKRSKVLEFMELSRQIGTVL